MATSAGIETLETFAARATETLKPLIDRRAEIRSMMLGQGAFPEPIWEAVADAGFFECMLPVEHGGNGLGLVGAATVLDRLGRLGFWNMMPILTSMAGLAIARSDDADLASRILPDVASGRIKICFAATEAHAGHNIFETQTIARETGDGYLINGQKIYISGAEFADYMLLVARTQTAEEMKAAGLPKAFALTLFLVNCKSEGIACTAMPVRGEVGVTPQEVQFTDVRVPRQSLVGAEHQGAALLFQAANRERVLLAATAIGLASFFIEKGSAYARERTVFRGEPIGKYQAVQHPLADARIRLEAARLQTEAAAGMIDRGDAPETEGFMANSAKYLASEAAEKALDAAIRAHGGMGFHEHHDLIYYLDNTRLMRAAPVSSEMVLNFVAEQVLNLPRSY